MPALVLLDLSDHLPRVRDALSDTTDDIPNRFVDEAIDDYIDNIFACVTKRDEAYTNLLDYKCALWHHDGDYDEQLIKIADSVGKMGLYIFEEICNMGGYLGGEYFPYFYSGRNTDDSIILAPFDRDHYRTCVLRQPA
jgi:hypothetical protein